MKFTSAILALAAAVMAAPYDNPPPPPSQAPAPAPGAGSGQCNNNQHLTCCSKVSDFFCQIDFLGVCAGGSYCCKASPKTGISIININADCFRLF
ncbi:hypothetical protein J3459_016998 [Metarhizium acridum]|uniref:uncharacterized protein n=1 Tax=Metarhizium acridum TaxID=92637 RepID=UPI001C6AC5E0|nr:hypothetical protein J3459_016998 [Metarhizium acridum]KAG8411575.1 hypothetical protein J3458_015635 [Metarhizium acridum]